MDADDTHPGLQNIALLYLCYLLVSDLIRLFSKNTIYIIFVFFKVPTNLRVSYIQREFQS